MQLCMRTDGILAAYYACFSLATVAMPHAEEIGFRPQGKIPYSLTRRLAQNRTVVFLQLELIPELKATCHFLCYVP